MSRSQADIPFSLRKGLELASDLLDAFEVLVGDSDQVPEAVNRLGEYAEHILDLV